MRAARDRLVKVARLDRAARTRARCLCAWLHVAQRRAKLRQRGQWWQQRRVRCFRKSLFGVWVDRFERSLWLREKVFDCGQRRKARLLEAWQSAAGRERFVREALLSAAQVRGRKIAAGVFAAWVRRAFVRRAAQSADDSRRRRAARRCLFAWAREVRLRLQVEKKQANRDAKLVYRALWLWRKKARVWRGIDLASRERALLFSVRLLRSWRFYVKGSRRRKQKFFAELTRVLTAETRRSFADVLFEPYVSTANFPATCRAGSPALLDESCSFAPAAVGADSMSFTSEGFRVAPGRPRPYDYESTRRAAVVGSGTGEHEQAEKINIFTGSSCSRSGSSAPLLLQLQSQPDEVADDGINAHLHVVPPEPDPPEVEHEDNVVVTSPSGSVLASEFQSVFAARVRAEQETAFSLHVGCVRLQTHRAKAFLTRVFHAWGTLVAARREKIEAFLRKKKESERVKRSEKLEKHAKIVGWFRKRRRMLKERYFLHAWRDVFVRGYKRLVGQAAAFEREKVWGRLLRFYFSAVWKSGFVEHWKAVRRKGEKIQTRREAGLCSAVVAAWALAVVHEKQFRARCDAISQQTAASRRKRIFSLLRAYVADEKQARIAEQAAEEFRARKQAFRCFVGFRRAVDLAARCWTAEELLAERHRKLAKKCFAEGFATYVAWRRTAAAITTHLQKRRRERTLRAVVCGNWWRHREFRRLERDATLRRKEYWLRTFRAQTSYARRGRAMLQRWGERLQKQAFLSLARHRSASRLGKKSSLRKAFADVWIPHYRLERYTRPCFAFWCRYTHYRERKRQIGLLLVFQRLRENVREAFYDRTSCWSCHTFQRRLRNEMADNLYGRRCARKCLLVWGSFSSVADEESEDEFTDEDEEQEDLTIAEGHQPRSSLKTTSRRSSPDSARGSPMDYESSRSPMLTRSSSAAATSVVASADRDSSAGTLSRNKQDPPARSSTFGNYNSSSTTATTKPPSARHKVRQRTPRPQSATESPLLSSRGSPPGDGSRDSLRYLLEAERKKTYLGLSPAGAARAAAADEAKLLCASSSSSWREQDAGIGIPRSTDGIKDPAENLHYDEDSVQMDCES
eukprot:g9012.t1